MVCQIWRIESRPNAPLGDLFSAKKDLLKGQCCPSRLDLL